MTTEDQRSERSKVSQSDDDGDMMSRFRTLVWDIDFATGMMSSLADCEAQYARLVTFVLSNLEARPVFVQCFRDILGCDITRFCMGHLQWPEIAQAARDRMKEDIHNSEYESLQKLLSVYGCSNEQKT